MKTGMMADNAPAVRAAGEIPAPRYARRILKPLERARFGRLRLQLPGGATLDFGQELPGACDAHVTLRRWAALRKALTGGALGWSEAYLDGDWDSPDIASLVEWFLRNEPLLGNRLEGGVLSTLLARLQRRRRANSRRGSRRNIAFHYDLGNAFYRHWLDETMTYSSALFSRPQQTLQEAQRDKYQHIVDTLDIRDGARVLEIGCGWGGFAEHLGWQRDVALHGITLSSRQLEFARERALRAGLSPQARFSFTDYRDVRGEYDHVVSIEMLEAVGEAYWPSYFDTVRRCLRPGGSAAIQVITIDDARFEGYRANPDFIQKHVFPGGMLPSPAVLRERAAAAGLQLTGEMNFGASYARTLREWSLRFQAAWPAIAAMGFDERFRRLWHYYLGYSEGGFRGGSIDVWQFFLRRQ